LVNLKECFDRCIQDFGRKTSGRDRERERDHLGDPGIDKRIILKWISRKWDRGMNRLRIGTGGGLL
jgi:hypothetical protein